MCDICNINENDPLEYGEIMTLKEIKVHYYCLLLSTHLPQNGSDNSGILGFLRKDILTLIKRAANVQCCYCNKMHASIKCAKCEKYFHLICGIKRFCLFEFIDEFISYCHEHQIITSNIITHTPEWGCYICRLEMGEYNPITSMMANCCSKGWVHRRCLKRYALSAGYYLKCLWCNKLDFREEVRRKGIFVPDRDAAWEQERNAYAGLHRGYSNCDADKCVCPKGRTIHTKKGRWELHICYTCGASGTHQQCYNKIIDKKNPYMCTECCEILNRTHSVHEENIPEQNGQIFDRSLYLQKSQTRYNNIDEFLAWENDRPNFDEDELYEPVQSTITQSAPEQRTAHLFKIDIKRGELIGIVQAKISQNPSSSSQKVYNENQLEILKDYSSNENICSKESINELFLRLINECQNKLKPINSSNPVVISDSDSDSDSAYHFIKKMST